MYIQTAEKKIQELRFKYSTAKEDGLSVEERQKLRNQISASMDRLKKKMESIHLRKLIQRQIERNEALMNDILPRILNND